jgi:hypothetical protein
MKIKSIWRRKWHDELTLENDVKIYLEAWHDAEMGIGLVTISYSQGDEGAERRVLEKLSYVGDYRQTIRRAMGIWSKDIPRIIKTIQGEEIASDKEETTSDD